MYRLSSELAGMRPAAGFVLALILQCDLLGCALASEVQKKTSAVQKPASATKPQASKKVVEEDSHKDSSATPRVAADKTKADVLFGQKQYPQAEQEYRIQVQQKRKDLQKCSEQLLSQEIGLIKTLLSENRTAEAEDEFKKIISAVTSNLDTALISDKLKLEFPDFARKLPQSSSAFNRGQLTFSAFRPIRSFRSVINDNLDATETEASLKQSLKDCDSLYGANTAKKLNLLLELCGLYASQMRRSEARKVLSQIPSVYSKLPADQQHYFANLLIETAESLNSVRLTNESSLLYRPVITAISNSSWPFDRELSNHLQNLGRVLEGQQQLMDAEDVYKASLRLAERSPEKDELTLATQQKHLAELLTKLKKFSAAEELYLMALQSEEKKLGATNSVTTQSRTQMFKLCIQSGREDESKNILDQILKTTETIDVAHARELQRNLNEIVSLLIQHGKLKSASDVLEKSIALGSRTNTLSSRDVVYQIDPLAKALISQGQTEDAIRLYNKVLEQDTLTERLESREYANFLQQATRTYLDNDMFDQALPLIRRRIEISKKSESPDQRYWLSDIAEQLNRKQRYAEAQVLYEELVPAEPPKDRDKFVQYAHVMLNLMMNFVHQHKYDDAKRICLKTLDGFSPYLIKASPYFKKELDSIAQEDMAKNDYQAINSILTNLSYSDVVRGTGTDLVNCIMQIAWRVAIKDPAHATSIMREAVELAKKNYGPADTRSAQILNQLADHLRRQGQTEEASAVTKEADEIRSTVLNKRQSTH